MNRIIAFTAILTVCILIFYGYYGGFSTIDFKEKTAGGETIIFKNTKGDYTDTEKATQEVISFLNKNSGIVPSRNVSFYHYNPHVIEKKNLKSEGGCILPSADTAGIKLINKDFGIRKLDTGKYVTAQCPYKGKISVLIAQIRVYPRLFRYLNDKGYDYMSPVTEIFDLSNHLITFRAKISPKKDNE